jgi:ABC-type lipoprotein release transport system permease subunit
VDQDLASLLMDEGLSISGSLPNGPDDVVIPQNMADIYGLEIGQQMHFVYEQIVKSSITSLTSTEERFLNLTVVGLLDMTGVSIRHSHDYYIVPFTTAELFLDNPNLFLVDHDHFQGFIDDLERVSPNTSLVEDPTRYFFNYLIFIDRDQVIDYVNSEDTGEKLTFIRNRLKMRGSFYDVDIASMNLDRLLSQYYNWVDSSRFSIIGLSLPILFLGAYMGAIGFELNANRRRRQVGLLKSRGATPRQVLLILWIEVIITGLIAGIVGYILGVCVSGFFLPQMLGQSTTGIGAGPFRFDSSSLFISIIFAIFLTFAAGFKHTRRIAKLQVIETLQKYAESTAKKEYSPRRDLIMIGLAAYSYVMIIVISFAGIPRQGFILMVIFALMTTLAIYLIPLTPLLLTFGLSRYIIQRHVGVFERISYIFKPLTKELHFLIPKNIRRNSRRVLSVSVLIVLALSLGIFITVTQAIEKQYLVNTYLYESGGDISVRGDFSSDVGTNISLLDGVDAVVNFTDLDFMEATLFGDWVDLRLVDFETYFTHVSNIDSFVVDGTPTILANPSNSESAIIISEGLAEMYGLQLGDSIYLLLINQSISTGPPGNSPDDGIAVDLTIEAIVKYLPGIAQSGIRHGNLNEIYIDYNSVDPEVYESIGYNYLVYSRTGFNSSEIANQIEGLVGDSSNIVVYDEKVSSLEDKTNVNSALVILEMEYFFILIMVTVGLGVVMYTASVERETEMANIIVRGASSKQVAKVLLGESLTIVTFATIIGLITGILTSFSVNQLSNFGQELLIERPFIIPPSFFWLLVITLVSLLLITLISTLRISRIKLYKALRRRGG